MDLPDLLKLLRRYGVTRYADQVVSIDFGDVPDAPKRKPKAQGAIPEDEVLPTDAVELALYLKGKP